MSEATGTEFGAGKLFLPQLWPWLNPPTATATQLNPTYAQGDRDRRRLGLI